MNKVKIFLDEVVNKIILVLLQLVHSADYIISS